MHDDLRDRILGDKWFKRAWTTQESTNSLSENLSYLIGWKDDLDVFGIAWRQVADASNRDVDRLQQTIFRGWEFDHHQMVTMSSMSKRHTDIMVSWGMSAFGGMNEAKKSFTLLDNGVKEIRLLSNSNLPQTLVNIFSKQFSKLTK